MIEDAFVGNRQRIIWSSDETSRDTIGKTLWVVSLGINECIDYACGVS